MRNGLILYSLLLIHPLPKGFALDTWSYGQQCADTLGVEVPPFNCNDARATVVPNNPDGRGRCDIPAHGTSGCNPGTTFLKYTDTFEADGKRQEVTTFIICRKTASDRNAPNRFSDVAVIQYNKTKNAACWFSRQQGDNQTVAPAPFTRAASATAQTEANNYWGRSQPNMDCRRCHEGSLWLRTPFAASVPQIEAGKGYVREGRTGNYQVGSGNAIPTGNQTWGPACNPGIDAWNNSPPTQLKINSEAYLARFPNRTPAAGDAAISTCTSCHYIGRSSSGFVCRLAANGTQIGAGRNALLRNATFPNNVWMPPRDHMERMGINTSPRAANGVTADQAARNELEKYNRMYARAIEAVSFCCNNPDATQNLDGTGTRRFVAILSHPRTLGDLQLKVPVP